MGAVGVTGRETRYMFHEAISQVHWRLEELADIYKDCLVIAAMKVSLRIILGLILTSKREGPNGFISK